MVSVMLSSQKVYILLASWFVGTKCHQVPSLCNNTEGNRAESREHIPARQIEVDLDFAITV
jgi:hypothetical protein